jgi:uncharacterized membrane protein (DUF106 family)
METQIEAFLNVNIVPNMEFNSLYYKYAKVKAEVNKLKDEQEKAMQRRSGMMSRGR